MKGKLFRKGSRCVCVSMQDECVGQCVEGTAVTIGRVDGSTVVKGVVVMVILNRRC